MLHAQEELLAQVGGAPKDVSYNRKRGGAGVGEAFEVKTYVYETDETILIFPSISFLNTVHHPIPNSYLH